MNNFPKPISSEIRAARSAAGLTQSEAASMVYASLRAWQQWEASDRRMPPASWELFKVKIALNERLKR